MFALPTVHRPYLGGATGARGGKRQGGGKGNRCGDRGRRVAAMVAHSTGLCHAAEPWCSRIHAAEPWCCRAVVLWSCGAVELWSCGAVVLQSRGAAGSTLKRMFFFVQREKKRRDK